MKTIFQNSDVEHSFHCNSVSCLTDENQEHRRHVPIFHFDTVTESYIAETIDAAARLWIKHGAKELVNVGRVG